MKPIEFEGSNCVFAKDQTEYLPLPAFKNNSEVGEVVSCWQLTWIERLKVLLRGRFYFSVWTFNKPLQPQRPFVDNPLTTFSKYIKLSQPTTEKEKINE